MMNTYARIQDGAVFELFQTDGDISEMFSAELIWVDATEVTPMPQEHWLASQSGDSWTFTAPATP